MAAMPSILVGVESKDESNAQEYLRDCSENDIFMVEIMALLNSDPPCNTDSVLGLGQGADQLGLEMFQLVLYGYITYNTLFIGVSFGGLDFM